MARAKKLPTICYNPVHKIDSLRSRRLRWIEHVSKGLRVVGYADKIAHLDHQGWFTDPRGDGGEVARGAVLRLTRAAGDARFLAAIADPWNPDCYIASMERFDDADEAAHDADSMAEAFAEAERDYQTRDTAACMIEADREEIRETRKTFSAIVAEMRAMRELARDTPVICKALRAQLHSLRATVRKDIRNIRKLREDPYAWLS